MRWLSVIALLASAACERRVCAGDLEPIAKSSAGAAADAGAVTPGNDVVVGHGGCGELMTDEVDHRVTLGAFEVTYTLHQYKGQTTMSVVPAKLRDPACNAVLEFQMPPGCDLALTGDGSDHGVVCRRFPQAGGVSADLEVLRFRRKPR